MTRIQPRWCSSDRFGVAKVLKGSRRQGGRDGGCFTRTRIDVGDPSRVFKREKKRRGSMWRSNVADRGRSGGKLTPANLQVLWRPGNEGSRRQYTRRLQMIDADSLLSSKRLLTPRWKRFAEYPVSHASQRALKGQCRLMLAASASAAASASLTRSTCDNSTPRDPLEVLVQRALDRKEGERGAHTREGGTAG